MNPFKKIHFLLTCKRVGPDMPLTHFLLYFKSLGFWLIKIKLKSVGTGASVRPHAYLVETKHISLGNNVTIRPGCMFFAVSNAESLGDITIEDNVLIGSGVHIYVSNHNHNYNDSNRDIYYQGHSLPKPVVIKRGAWIGAGAILLPGVSVGRNAVVGAGSVVTKSVPDATVYAGNPAHFVRAI